MTKAPHAGDYEPTLSDVLEAVQTGFARVDARLDRHEEILMGHDEKLGRHDQLLNALVASHENLTERMNVFDERLTRTQNRVEDIAEMLESSAGIAEDNTSTLRNHEGRITRLERAASPA